MKKIITLSMTALFLLAAPAIAYADDKEPVPEYMQKKLDNRQLEMKALDVNKDGILQASELGQKAEKTFDSADVNKDGVISSEESAAAMARTKTQNLEATGSKSQANRQAMRTKSQYKNADRNDDGTVSKQEYEAFFGSRHQTFDRNGDGVVTTDEYRSDSEKLPSAYRKKED